MAVAVGSEMKNKKKRKIEKESEKQSENEAKRQTVKVSLTLQSLDEIASDLNMGIIRRD